MNQKNLTMIAKNVVIDEMMKAFTELKKDGYHMVDIDMEKDNDSLVDRNKLIIHPIMISRKEIEDVIRDPRFNIEDNLIFDGFEGLL